jgi:hypothetical protein
MMDTHIEIMKLAIGYACVGIFIATAIAAILSLYNILSLESDIKKKLNTVLLIEVVSISIAVFAGLLNLNHKSVMDKVAKTEVELANTEAKLEKSHELLLLAPVRVFIQIGNELQRPSMEVLRQKLTRLGFIVLGIENVGIDKLPTNPSVRYFYDEDKVNANVVAEQLRLSGFAAASIVRLNNTNARTGTLEIWLGK